MKAIAIVAFVLLIAGTSLGIAHLWGNTAQIIFIPCAIPLGAAFGWFMAEWDSRSPR